MSTAHLTRTSFALSSFLSLSALFVTTPALAWQASDPEQAEQAEQSEQQPDPRALDRRRLLALEDGSVLRARSRFTGEYWERREGSKWVPTGLVAAHRLEKEVLAESRRLESKLSRDDHEKRVGLADWMVRQGLYAEAIGQLDRVLRKVPEDRGALALIARAHIPLELPHEVARNRMKQVSALVKLGASGTPATREVAVRNLASFPGLDVRSLVKAELTTMQNRRRAFATLAARRLFRGELLQELSSRAMLDGFGEVRQGAAYALRDAGDVAVLGPALNSLNSEFANVRANAAESLGDMGYAAAVQPLVAHLAALQSSGAPTGTRASAYIGNQLAYVMDYDVEIAQAASIADPIVGTLTSGMVFDVRTVVQMTEVVEMQKVMGSLSKLTGAKPGRSPQAWMDWWEENEGEWRSQELAQRSRPATGGSTGN